MNTPQQPSACIHFRDGRVLKFQNQTLAYQTWLSLPCGTRAAFRGKGDNHPVYAWDTDHGIDHSLFIQSVLLCQLGLSDPAHSH